MTTIRNQRGITRVQRLQDKRVAGQPVGRGYNRPYTNPLLAQITTLTLAEQADVSDEIVAGQVWTLVLTDPDTIPTTVLYTVTGDDATAGTDAEGLAYMAGVLAAALEGAPGLDNVIDALGVGPDIVVTWKHADQGAWTITAVCAPAAAEQVLLATPVTSQTAGGLPLPMARFVVMGAAVPEGPRRASLPSAAGQRIVGITLRDTTQVRDPTTAFAAVDEYPAGTTVGVRELGDIDMPNVGPASVAGDPVHSVISTAGGQLQGEATSERAGVADVWTSTPTVANTVPYELTISIAEQDGLPAISRPFRITSDGTATATEICDALRALMVADAAFAARVVVPAAGAATLVLTGQEPGVVMSVLDTQPGPGDWASIVNTVPAVAYTQLVPDATWVLPTPTNTVGTLNLR